MSSGAQVAAAGGGERAENAQTGRLSALVFALLVLASFAAFFLAQRLKHIPTAVQDLKLDPAFYPDGGGAPRREPISFEIERPDLVTVEILDTAGAPVATLARARPLAAYTQLDLRWNGRRGLPRQAGVVQPNAPAGGRPARASAAAGAPAPAGEYRLRIRLLQRKLEVRSPASIELIRKRS